jgi:hypothetical protein
MHHIMKNSRILSAFLAVLLAAAFPLFGHAHPAGVGTQTAERIRIIVETDAGGDPDDEQSLVRFLLYSNEWDVEGIIANRPVAREPENLNSQRTGLGIVQAMIRAYGECYPHLIRHDPRYPTMDALWKRTVAGYDNVEDGVNLIIAAVDSPDPRPVWFSNWGTDHGAATSCLKRALDKVLKERGPDGYAKFKSRLRLSSSDKFGDHTWNIDPPFPLWIDAMQPEIAGKRWYHQFSTITAKAGGFDIEKDVRTGHGPLGALYPLNTNRPQKEGDTMTFLYFLPNGLSDPAHPTWGSWAGRHGLQERAGGRQYYWANVEDTWQGSSSRDNTLMRWAVDLQNDFKARMDWCVKNFLQANHAPDVRVAGAVVREVRSGQTVVVDASASADPDGDRIELAPVFYPEASGFPLDLPDIKKVRPMKVKFKIPTVEKATTLHLLMMVHDDGSPRLTGYQRIIFEIEP